MGIIQYSRIQHRRGSYTDLISMAGPLNTSELGHILDQQRLFIGNGQISEGAIQVGNTEIITDATLLNNPNALKYSYQSNIGIVPQTGINAQTPTIRSIGQILDDYVSVKDFGAVGDGITDDTAAINRALQQLYCSPNIPLANPTSAYRKLFFPAGLYIVSSFLYVPPHAMLVGEEGTIIQQANSGTNALFKTVDSMFQSGAMMGMGGAALPTNITFQDITLQQNFDNTIIRLERASDVFFQNVKFIGAWNNTNLSSTSAAIYLDSLGTAFVPTNIRGAFCSFFSTFYGLSIPSNAPDANRIYFEFCYFENQNNSVFTTPGCSDIKTSNSKFKNILGTVITASPLANSICSTNNTFDTCGSITAPVLWFQNNVANFATNCTSIGDTFINCPGVEVQNDGRNTIILSTGNNPLVLQNIAIFPVQPSFTLANTVTPTPTVTGYSIDLSRNDTAFIDYTLIRGTSVRIGRLSILCKGSNISQAVVTDLFSENNPTGIAFDFSLSGSTLSVVYTDNLNSAVVSTWNIQPKLWNS